MIHIVDGRFVDNLPGNRPTAIATSLAFHLCVAGLAAAAALSYSVERVAAPPLRMVSAAPAIDSLVFIAAQSTASTAGGGGGGGNGQPLPIRRAESPGTDRATLRVAKPVSTTGRTEPIVSLPELVLDAAPLASGTIDQLGLPFGGVPTGSSLGPGTGGGVGDGIGTGIGSGRGPGYGDGSGGGMGGGVYRPGGSVSAPRVIVEVRPTYTDRAMVDHIEGSVLLEMIVQTTGVPSSIRVVRSLDPGGLDEQALRAAAQWRFAPGRLNGTPVDVLVLLQVDFHLR